MEMSEIAIVLLAAGKGSRMNSKLPKVLIPVLGKPMLMHAIEQTSLVGDAKTIAVVGYGKEEVKKAFGEAVLYADQEEQLGTGHAVLQAQEKVTEMKSSILVILNGDHPFVRRIDIERLLDEHKKRSSTLTLGTITVKDEELFENSFSGFGRVFRNGGNEIISIIESRDCTPKELLVREVNPNIICVDAAWAFQQLSKTPKNDKTGEYYITSLIPAALEQGLVVGSISVPASAGMGANTSEEIKALEKFVRESREKKG